MAGPALAYAYRYPHASTLEGTPTGANLRLATWSARGSPHPHFFEGQLRRPGRAADLLRGLVEVVQSRFYLPPAMMARIMAQSDPVVTGSGDMLRFEAFSACCSTYGRVDLLPEAIDGTWHGRGTTNVDFSAPMRAALARIRDADQVHLAVGSDLVSLRKDAEAVVERKVALAGPVAEGVRRGASLSGANGPEAGNRRLRGRAVPSLSTPRLGDVQRLDRVLGPGLAGEPGGGKRRNSSRGPPATAHPRRPVAARQIDADLHRPTEPGQRLGACTR